MILNFFSVSEVKVKFGGIFVVYAVKGCGGSLNQEIPGNPEIHPEIRKSSRRFGTNILSRNKQKKGKKNENVKTVKYV